MRRATRAVVVTAVSAVALLVGVGPRAGRRTDAEPPAPAERRAGPPNAVGALGRLEPKDGVIRVAGPARPSAVVAELLVEEGDRVAEGAPLAILDARAADAAAVARAEAELADARAALDRLEPLYRQRVVSAAARDEAQRRVAVEVAALAVARAALALDTVRAPVGGRVLAVHARPGERIGAEGLLELGQTDTMYAVAEVYETDVAAVRAGQRATVRSPALAAPLAGRVERVGLKVQRQAVLAADPIADVDARVVEVEVRLDDGDRVADLSHLEVDVIIDTGAP